VALAVSLCSLRCTPPDDLPPGDDDTADDDDSGAPADVERGDLALYGRNTLSPDDEGYEAQQRLLFRENAAAGIGLLTPLWGADMPTWDDHACPAGARTVWEDLAIVTEPGVLPEHPGLRPLVLRPTPQLHDEVDVEAMAARYESVEPTWGDPLLPVLVAWLKWPDNPQGWLQQSDLFDRWEAIYGVHFGELPTPTRYQFSPHEDGASFSDMELDGFWERDFTPASLVAWCLLWGGHQGSWDSIRPMMRDHPDAVAAVDVIAPGQLARRLVEDGYLEVVDPVDCVDVSVRNEMGEWSRGRVGWPPLDAVEVKAEYVDAGGDAELRLHCDGEVTTTEMCGFDEPGIHEVTAELLRGGEVVASERALVALAATGIPAEQGDIALWGQPAVRPDDPRFETQVFRTWVQRPGLLAGVGAPFFGDGTHTWDDTATAVDERYVWNHVEVVGSTGPYSAPEDADLLLLRPTGAVDLDLAAMAQRHDATFNAYARPFFGGFVRWVQSGEAEGIDDTQIAHWATTAGIDLATLPTPQMMQHSPYLDPADYTDIASERFWARDTNCSNTTVWSWVWGTYQAQGEGVRERFLDDLDEVAAVDTATPGVFAWWLVENGYAEVVYAP